MPDHKKDEGSPSIPGTPVPTPPSDTPPVTPVQPPTPPVQPPGRAPFDEPTLRRFLSYIVDPTAGATELRILNAHYDIGDHTGNTIVVNPRYSSTLSAWYDNVNAIVNDTRKLKCVSAYICLNPTTPDLLARSYNRLTKVRNATTDDDIVCLRWFYIDVDPVRPADISATQEELAKAVEKRDLILADHPEIRRVSLTGRSGNGAFIMARLPDYPNDHEHRSLVAAALDSIIARYSDSVIKIDVKTKNPSRVGCVPGTLKCKGSHVPARPWKMATLEGEPDSRAEGDTPQPPTLDLRDWLARNPAPVAQVVPRAPARPTPTQPWATYSPHDDQTHRLRRAEAYVDRMPEAISGQNGHDATFNVACALVKGFDLSTSDARSIIDNYNSRCSPPWAAHEIEHKLADADARPDDKPRGYLYDARRDDGGDISGSPRTPYAGPGADFMISQVVQATGGTVAHLGNGDGNGHANGNGHAAPMLPAVRISAAHPGPPGSPVAPGSPVPLEPIKARAAHHVANARIEDLYRDTDFLGQLARLERSAPGEAEAIKAVLGRIRDFRARSFKLAMDGVRPGQRKSAIEQLRPDEPPPFDPSDMGNADLLLAAHGHQLRYVKAYGDWMVNDGRRWKEDRENTAGQWAQEVPGMIGERITPDMDDDAIEGLLAWQLKSKSNERLRAALSVAMARVTTTPETFDRDEWLFNCQNGTIDLRTGEFRDHDPADYLTKISPVIYDPDAKCPLWDAFIFRIMKGDRETADYVRRIMGYAMTGSVKDHAIFICYGSGSNGKTSALSTISFVLGDYACDLDPEIILAQANAMHPTGLTDLEGRRFVVCEETDDKRGIAEALLKRISGGGKIRARKIGQNYYDFDPTHKLILATNHLPDVKGNDDGIWRRLKLIPFEMKFDGKSGERPDTDMPAKLKAEAAGILNWMLEGLKDWQANGLADCPVVQRATGNFREESDKLGSFLADRTIHVEGEPRARAVFSVLYGEYLDWAANEGIKHTVSKQKLGRMLGDKGYKVEKPGGVTYRVGLLLKINGRDPRTLDGYDPVTGQPLKAAPATQGVMAYAGGEGADGAGEGTADEPEWDADRE